MVREYKKEDREIYMQMASEFYSSDAVLHSIPQSYIRKTADEAEHSSRYAQIYILEHDGLPAGYALTARTFSQEAGGIVIWIEEIYIREEFRSRGLGREFFFYIEKTGDAARLRLEVEEDNTGAAALYRKIGYEELPYVQMVKDRKN